MLLALPDPAFGVEGHGIVTGEPFPWHIDRAQALPLRVAFGRGHFGLFIDDMLEMIHERAVGDEGQRGGQPDDR